MTFSSSIRPRRILARILEENFQTRILAEILATSEMMMMVLNGFITNEYF
jgi:hypothetical protein